MFFWGSHIWGHLMSSCSSLVMLCLISRSMCLISPLHNCHFSPLQLTKSEKTLKDHVNILFLIRFVSSFNTCWYFLPDSVSVWWLQNNLFFKTPMLSPHFLVFSQHFSVSRRPLFSYLSVCLSIYRSNISMNSEILNFSVV